MAHLKKEIISTGFNHGSEKATGASSTLSSASLNWNGGNIKYHVQTMSKMTPDYWRLWESSLAKEPALLCTEMSLLPIYEIVDRVDPEKRAGCRDALEDFLGGKFTIYSKKEEDEEMHKTRDEITNRQEAAESVETGAKKCFPGISRAIVKNSNKPKLTKDLEIGDEVLCFDSAKQELVFSPVYMFGHRDPDQTTLYLEIMTAAGMIFISDKHLLFRQDQSGDPEAVFAEDIRCGDKIYQLDAKKQVEDLVPMDVVSIRKTSCKGVYAPFTLAGTIIVDGMLASCYANIKKPSLLELCPHALAHKILAPLRGLFQLGLSSRLMIKDGEDQPEIIRSMTQQFESYFWPFNRGSGWTSFY